MATNVIAAIETLMSLQRWNVMPRVENWTEGENIAYATHVVYALARQLGWPDLKIEHAVMRSLLKSLNKHFLADIPVKSRRILRQISDEDGNQAFEKLINEYARKTAKLFPRQLSKFLEEYMTIDGNYSDGLAPDDKKDIESLIRFAQLQVALDECDTNERVYPGRGYEAIHEDIQLRIKETDDALKYTEEYERIRSYLGLVKNLKYLRRWNRINRTVETSVLSHTFIVSILALMFAQQAKSDFSPPGEHIALDAMLRALFHDFPETLTGDIITPAKDILNKSCESMWEKVEERLINAFVADLVPEGLRKDISERQLLHELSDSDNYSVSSLVKDCDRLALVIECHMEFRNGNINGEMTNAFKEYLSILQGSEWKDVREFSQRIAIDSR